MKNTKFEITHENNKIYFQFTTPEFYKTGFTGYTDELWQIISIAKWRTDGKYIYSGKKTLHRIVMEYWYGKVRNPVEGDH